MIIPWKNTDTSYGLIAILLHWLVALIVIGMFVLGLWMTGLTYYDAWYRRAPALHKSIGIALLGLMFVRLFWKALNPQPRFEAGISPSEAHMAKLAHMLLYLLPLMVMISGYLISTADGRALEAFGWISIPATLSGLKNQEDIAGLVHLILASSLIALASVHALAALKHHFIDHDRTLLRMVRPAPPQR